MERDALFFNGLKEDVDFILEYMSPEHLIGAHKTANKNGTNGWSEEFPYLKETSVEELEKFLYVEYAYTASGDIMKPPKKQFKKLRLEKDDVTRYLISEDYDSMIDIAIMTNDIEWRNELLMKASGING